MNSSFLFIHIPHLRLVQYSLFQNGGAQNPLGILFSRRTFSSPESNTMDDRVSRPSDAPKLVSRARPEFFHLQVYVQRRLARCLDSHDTPVCVRVFDLSGDELFSIPDVVQYVAKMWIKTGRVEADSERCCFWNVRSFLRFEKRLSGKYAAPPHLLTLVDTESGEILVAEDEFLDRVLSLVDRSAGNATSATEVFLSVLREDPPTLMHVPSDQLPPFDPFSIPAQFREPACVAAFIRKFCDERGRLAKFMFDSWHAFFLWGSMKGRYNQEDLEYALRSYILQFEQDFFLSGDAASTTSSLSAQLDLHFRGDNIFSGLLSAINTLKCVTPDARNIPTRFIQRCVAFLVEKGLITPGVIPVEPGLPADGDEQRTEKTFSKELLETFGELVRNLTDCRQLFGGEREDCHSPCDCENGQPRLSPGRGEEGADPWVVEGRLHLAESIRAVPLPRFRDRYRRNVD